MVTVSTPRWSATRRPAATTPTAHSLAARDDRALQICKQRKCNETTEQLHAELVVVVATYLYNKFAFFRLSTETETFQVSLDLIRFQIGSVYNFSEN